MFAQLQAHHLRRTLLLSGVLALAALAAIGLGHALAQSSPQAGNYRPILGAPCISCRPLQSQPVGVPAIAPRLSMAASAGPHFAVDDVRQFFATHDPGDTVVSVQFLTAQQVGAQLGGEATGMPNGSLLCLVHISGTFAEYGPLPGPPHIFHDAVLVFDAHTGNALMASGGL